MNTYIFFKKMYIVAGKQVGEGLDYVDNWPKKR